MAELAGQSIGQYRIIRKLGEGGMGVVYEAEQQHPRRAVALKVIRGGRFASDAHFRRFEREAEALARLKHPGIAAIYETGTSEEGQPYYTMELVLGVPLSEYLRERPLGGATHRSRVAERLDLFLKICDAVSYAHQRGVIHRDLKPSNTMVNQDPARSGSSEGTAGSMNVKVLDFGLARMVDEETALTDSGTIQGTLPYMSPEQAMGRRDDIGVQSDVYALGVVLYEMLTEVLPYSFESMAPLQAWVVITAGPPMLPSRVWRAHGWRLGRDLETIVLKALEKDRSRRYQSVAAIAEDIDRYRHDQPILARPASTAYQLTKLIRRHKLASAFLVAIFALISSAAVVTTLQRNRARAAEGEARAINEFLQGMLASVDPWQRGRDVRVVQVLERAAQSVDTAFSDQPATKAAVRATIGRTLQNLGLLPEAEPHLREALTLRQSTFRGDNPAVATSLYDMAEFLLQKGDFERAEANAREAVAMRRRALGPKHPDVAASLNQLAVIVQARGRFDEAERLYHESMALREPGASGINPGLLETQDNLASLLYDLRRFAEAESLYRETLAQRRRAFGEENLDVASSMNDLAMALVVQEKWAESESLYVRSLDVNRRLLGDEHPRVAQKINNLGMFYYRQGDYARAEALLLQALALNRKVLGTEHPEVAIGLNNMALLRSAQGRKAEAADLFRQALAIDLIARGANHPDVAQEEKSLAAVLVDLGSYSEAEQLYSRVLKTQRTLYSSDHFEIATTESLLGALYTRTRRFAEAESLLVRAYGIIRPKFGDDHGRTRAVRRRLVALYEAWGRPAKAAEYRQ